MCWQFREDVAPFIACDWIGGRGRVGRLHEGIGSVAVAGDLATVEIDGQCGVSLAGKSPGHGTDVVVEAPPLMDDDQSGAGGALGRPGHEACHGLAVDRGIDHVPFRDLRRRRGLGHGVGHWCVVPVLGGHPVGVVVLGATADGGETQRE